MLSLNSYDSKVTIVGAIKSTFQNGTENYKVFFSGPYTPRYGEVAGCVAGYEDCDKETFEAISKKTYPFTCTGCIFYDDKRAQYKLAGVRLTEVKA